MLKKIFGSRNDRLVRQMSKRVKKINALEASFQKLSDEELQGKTAEFKARLKKGETLDQLLNEAFAAVREGSVRTLGMRHYDVQLIGGMVLNSGQIAEMRTGEGKTREDHKKVADQVFALYAEGKDLRGLVAIVGEEALSDRDKRKLNFAKIFEDKFLQQGIEENRDFIKTMDLAWEILGTIPREELVKIDNKFLFIL